MGKLKSKRKAFEKGVVKTNRLGCGCIIAIFIGFIIAMIFAGASK